LVLHLVRDFREAQLALRNLRRAGRVCCDPDKGEVNVIDGYQLALAVTQLNVALEGVETRDRKLLARG
jgi:hypothetical protein